MAVARYLADKSVWARVRQPAILSVMNEYVERGLIGTCPIVELEILFSARTGPEHTHFPLTDEIARRTIEVQGLLAQRAQHRSVSIPDLLVAATAERFSLVVLHYDGDYERIAEITGQPTKWIVPAGTADQQG
jgi:predicted nucleic acid-binding protein